MPLTVLIAADDRDIALVVTFAARLIWADCRALVAAGGGTALQHFADEGPDVVVLDVQMLPPDGFEVCRRIHETSGVPILLLTPRDSPADRARALALGARDYLTKPFAHDDLLAHLRAPAPASGGQPRDGGVQASRCI